MRRDCISLDNFAEWSGEVNGVEIDSRLPLSEHVPASEIDVDLGRIGRLVSFGRLQRLEFRFDGEDQAMAFSVDEADQNGATNTAASKAPTVIGLKEATFPRGNGLVRVDGALNNELLGNPKAWANLFDKEIKDGLKNASRQ